MTQSAQGTRFVLSEVVVQPVVNKCRASIIKLKKALRDANTARWL